MRGPPTAGMVITVTEACGTGRSRNSQEPWSAARPPQVWYQVESRTGQGYGKRLSFFCKSPLERRLSYEKRTFSIRTSVILCLLVSIIPVDLMFIVFSNHSIRSIFEKTEESYRMSIDSAAAVFEESFRILRTGWPPSHQQHRRAVPENAATPEERYHYAYSLSQDLSVAAGSAGVSFVYDGRQFYFSMGQDISAEDKRSMRYSSLFHSPSVPGKL